jgi:hypothetical protein
VVIKFNLIEYFSKFYLISNTLGLFDGGSTSLEKRFAQYGELHEVIPLGRGVLPSSSLIIENGFVFEIIKNGLFSVITISLFYLLPTVMALSVYLQREKPLVCEVASIWILACVFGSVSNVFIYPPKISSLYWIMIGLLFAYLHRNSRPAYVAGRVEAAK